MKKPQEYTMEQIEAMAQKAMDAEMVKALEAKALEGEGESHAA